MEERLKKLVILVDNETYTAAAAALHTSQPALTMAMQKLVREIQSELFLAGTRKLQLTPSGQIAYDHGQQLILAEKNFRQLLQSLASKRQTLNLGCIDSIADIMVRAELLKIFELDSVVSLTVHSSATLLDELSKGRLDLAIIAEQSSYPSIIQQRVLGKEQFALICSSERSAEYLTAQKGGVLYNFLAYNKVSTTNTLLHKQLEDNGLHYEARLYSTNPSVLLELALQGQGIAALPVSLVKTHLAGRLTELKLKKPLYRPIVALWQIGHRLPRVADDFLKEITALQTGM